MTFIKFIYLQTVSGFEINCCKNKKNLKGEKNMSGFSYVTSATIVDTDTITSNSNASPSSTDQNFRHNIEQNRKTKHDCIGVTDESQPNHHGMQTQLNTKAVVRQMFKTDQNVISILEASNRVDFKQPSRILALVKSGSCKTYAIFSLAIAVFPLRDRCDLSIDKFFPVNETFKMSSKNSHLILSNSDNAAFEYYLCISSDLNKFQETLNIGRESIISGCVLDFGWLNDYHGFGEPKDELKRREHEYIIYKDIKIYCATWNVNNKSCYESELQLWLMATEPADIYVIGLQELDTSTKAIATSADKPDQTWISKWLSVVNNNNNNFVELRSKRLVGMMITVIIRKDIEEHIKYVKSGEMKRGIFNAVGNKGCVAISLKLYEDYICFINSHLAANLDAVELRNEDYAAIVNKLSFEEQRRFINDHALIFWIGDLNYRIEIPPNLEPPTDHSDSDAYKRLLQYDQLRYEQSKGKCFDGYKEAPIEFPPTYKYDVGTDRFDTSEKQRAPAYCDRVLWKGDRIKNLTYKCVMDIRQSDHKPVYALFNTKIKKYDVVVHNRIHEEVLKLVDKRENENQPQIIVDSETIDFELVRFNEVVVREFKVRRNCSTPVDFMFKEKTSNRICEKWLQIEPVQASLVNDNPQTVCVKFLADVKSIAELLKQIQTDNLKYGCDILVLHVKNGRDIFITIKCVYQPSCFGLSMETLCRTDRPLGSYTQSEMCDLMNTNTSKYLITMPREFFILIDYLHKQGEKATGAFNSKSLEYKHTRTSEINNIRDWLDTWSREEFPGTPQAAAEALLLLLDLPEQSLLNPYTKDLLQVECIVEAREYIEKLSSPNKNVFIHLCMFLREGIAKNYYNSSDIITIFGRVIFRNEKNNTRCNRFLMQFICPDFGN